MSRRGKAATDALRACWRSGNFLGACAELKARPVPDPATLRRVLSAREMGRATDRPARQGFTQALCLMALGAPAALALRPDIAQQMRQNGSLRLVLSHLCEPHGSITGQGHLDDEQLVERAVDALIDLQPEAVLLPLTRTINSGNHYQFYDKNTPPVWTRAPALPWRLRQKLIARARILTPLDPDAAWTALIYHIGTGARADCLKELACAARAPSASLFSLGLALIAQSHYRYSETKSEWSLSERLPLMALLCRAHSDMPGAIHPAAMLGSWPETGTDEARRRRLLGVLPKRIDGRVFRNDSERASSLSALDWFHACAELCARLGAPDVIPFTTELKPIEAAYTSYLNLRGHFEAGQLDDPRDEKVRALAQAIAFHKFPTLAPTLAESFNVVKSRMEIAAVATSAPARSTGRRAL